LFFFLDFFSFLSAIKVDKNRRHSRDRQYDLGTFIEQQISNCHDALLQARAHKLRWLYHLDVDELFVINGATGHGSTLAEHLAWYDHALT
jgi:hypothetical protein